MNADDARVEAARARLAKTMIRTPFFGRIGLRRVSPGDFVDSSSIITTLDDTRTIKLDFSIPGTFLSAVTEGMTITARSTLYPETEFSGLVRNLDTRLDPVVRAIQIRAELPNDENLLKPGMLLTVKLQQDRGNVLIVPEGSIVPERGEQFVYLVENNRATKRKVMLGRRLAGLVEITTGLKAGDTVVTDGAHKIREGMLLEILSLPAAGASIETTGSKR
jgi:membrane fusion protein (multidrug efflux system)